MKRTLTNPISYWRAFYARQISPGQAVIGFASLLILVLISIYAWYHWYMGTLVLGREFWTTNRMLVAQAIIAVSCLGIPLMFGREQVSKRETSEADTQRHPSQELTRSFFGNVGDPNVPAQQPVLVQHNLLTRIGMWVQEQYKKVGGHENAAALVLAFALLVLFWDFLSRTKILGLIPLGLCVAWAVRGYKDRRKLFTGVRIAIALAIGLTLSALTFGYQARESGTVQGSFLASVERLSPFQWMGRLFGDDEEPAPAVESPPAEMPTPTPTLPLQVEIFSPDTALQGFTSEFSEGAKSELLEVLGFLNSAIQVTQEAEAQRTDRQASRPEVLLALNTTPLLEGTATDTGIAESQAVVDEWLSRGVKRADGTYEASSFAERVETQHEQLEAEGLNVQALLETARKLNDAYKAFVETLKALQVNEEGLIKEPNRARAQYQDFQVQVATVNAQLGLLGIDERVLVMDLSFVDNLLANEANRQVTVEVTATPQMRQVSESVAEFVAPSATPLPTNTAVPTTTSVPVGSITVNVSFFDPFTPNVPLIGVILYQGGTQVSELKTSYPGGIAFDNLPVGQLYDVAVFTDYPGMGCMGMNGTHNVGDTASYTLAGSWYPCEDTRLKLNNGLAPVPPTPALPIQPIIQPTVVVNGTPVVIQEVRGLIHVVVGINPTLQGRTVAVVLYDGSMNVVDRKEVSDIANFYFENVLEGTYTVAVSVPSPNGAVSKCFVTALSGIPLGGNARFSYEVNDPAQFWANCL